MKNIFFALSLTVIMLFSFVAAVAGAGIMAYDAYSGGPNFTHGFNVFCLGTILFFVTISSYMITKILTSTSIIADVMTKFIEHEMTKTVNQPENPFTKLFGGLGNNGLPGFGATGTLSISSLDEDGTITPLGETNFTNAEDLIKNRDEILNRAFGPKSGIQKKDINDMTIDELQAEEQLAISQQDFELAAAVRDLVLEKTKNN